VSGADTSRFGGSASPPFPTSAPAPTSPAGRADDTDLDLLRRHVAGDPEAFVQLFETHRNRLWRVALAMLGDAGDAEDALQEAMLSAHRKAADFEARAAVATWLHRIVVNAALTQLRRRKVRPTSPMPTDADGFVIEPPDPRDVVAETDLHLDVVRALAGLSEDMRTTIVLVDVHGYPVAEVARLLSVPEGTVKSRCSRARARLAVALGHLRPGNPATVHAVSLMGQGPSEHGADASAPGVAHVPGPPRGHDEPATEGEADGAGGGDRR
jgi:RNA polymerase sigma-70 factor (ECF subfamily)